MLTLNAGLNLGCKIVIIIPGYISVLLLCLIMYRKNFKKKINDS